MPYLFLSLAIVAEVIGTSALKATDGFTRLAPSALVVVAYGAAFYCLALALKTIPVGLAYAIWSGAGTALIALISWAVLKQRLPAATWMGIGMIVAGVVLIHLASTGAP